MTYTHIVRPFYIDNELQLKKIEIFSKKTPRGAWPPFWGPFMEKCLDPHIFGWTPPQVRVWIPKN